MGQMGQYVKMVKFSYIACSMSMNWEFHEESCGDSFMTHGWSPDGTDGVSTPKRSNFHI